MKWASGTNIVLGAWLIMAPWVLRYDNSTAATEDVVLGILVLGVAIWSTSVSARVTGPASMNVLCGAWVSIAPWVLGYSTLAPRASAKDKPAASMPETQGRGQSQNATTLWMLSCSH